VVPFAMKVSDVFVSGAQNEIRTKLALARQCNEEKKQEEAIKHLLEVVGAQNEIIKHFWAVLASTTF
jgi:hypothetical protein